jgi:hypothetical protein
MLLAQPVICQVVPWCEKGHWLYQWLGVLLLLALTVTAVQAAGCQSDACFKAMPAMLLQPGSKSLASATYNQTPAACQLPSRAADALHAP